MRKLFYLLFVSSALLSCGEDTNPGSINRFFYTNSEISAPEDGSGTHLNWTDGNRIVFRYVIQHPDEVNISDDELTEVFWIEIPSNVTEFSQNLNTDSDVETYYTRVCYCGFEAFEFTELEVSGNKKTNGTWEVSIKMKAKSDSGPYEHEYSLEDTGIYFPGQREG